MSEALRRIAAGIEYAGTRYAGWQRQPGAASIQSEVEAALGFVADHEVEVTCAGRTDAGVHALGQVLHFDTPAARTPRGWVLGANARLPADIALGWACEVPPDFNARRSALSRTYRYLILQQPTRPAVLDGRVCWWRQSLDAEAMQAGAGHLLGEHDFSAFRASECQSRSPVRRLDVIRLTGDGPWLTLEVRGNAFLHHMVRNIVGTLLLVGEGERPPDWVAGVLASRDRRQAGVTAPAAGLYLWQVEYPADLALPALPASGPWAIIPP